MNEGEHMTEGFDQKALIVDFGGVLTTDIWSSFADFCEQRGLDAEAAKRLFRENPEAIELLRGLETGKVSQGDFEKRFAELLGTEPEGLIEGLFAGLEPVEPMMELLERAPELGIPTGLISNSWVMDHYTEEIRELFDVVIISAEVGLHKPQPEIYRLAAERLGLEPEDCIFVDDLRENVEGAEAVGMTGVLHRDVDETIARVDELLGVALSA
jgi:epoxide hydrolase-like predicted phosphatase